MVYDAEKGNFAIALTGDSMLTRKLSNFTEPAYLKLAQTLRGADACFGNRVFRLQLVRLAAQFGGHPRGEFVAGGEKHLRPKTLQERAPGIVTRQRRSQRTDALRGHDRDQPRLT